MLKTLVIFGEIAQSIHFFSFFACMHNKNAAPIAAAPLNGLKLAPSLQKLTLNYGVGDKQGASGIQMWQHGNFSIFPPNAVAPDCMYEGDNGISIVTHTTTSLKPTEVECMFSKSLLFLLLSEHLNHGVGLLQLRERRVPIK